MTTDADRANLFDAAIARMNEKVDSFDAAIARVLNKTNGNHWAFIVDPDADAATANGTSAKPFRSINQLMGAVPHRSVVRILPTPGKTVDFNTDGLDGTFCRTDIKGCAVNIIGDAVNRAKILLVPKTRGATDAANTDGFICIDAPAHLTVSDVEIETLAPPVGKTALTSYSGIISRGSGNRSQQFPIFLGLRTLTVDLNSPLIGALASDVKIALDGVTINKKSANGFMVDGSWNAVVNIHTDGVITIKKEDGTPGSMRDLIPAGIKAFLNGVAI